MTKSSHAGILLLAAMASACAQGSRKANISESPNKPGVFTGHALLFSIAPSGASTPADKARLPLKYCIQIEGETSQPGQYDCRFFEYITQTDASGASRERMKAGIWLPDPKNPELNGYKATCSILPTPTGWNTNCSYTIASKPGVLFPCSSYPDHLSSGNPAAPVSLVQLTKAGTSYTAAALAPAANSTSVAGLPLPTASNPVFLAGKCATAATASYPFPAPNASNGDLIDEKGTRVEVKKDGTVQPADPNTPALPSQDPAAGSGTLIKFKLVQDSNTYLKPNTDQSADLDKKGTQVCRLVWTSTGPTVVTALLPQGQTKPSQSLAHYLVQRVTAVTIGGVSSVGSMECVQKLSAASPNQTALYIPHWEIVP